MKQGGRGVESRTMTLLIDLPRGGRLGMQVLSYTALAYVSDPHSRIAPVAHIDQTNERRKLHKVAKWRQIFLGKIYRVLQGKRNKGGPSVQPRIVPREGESRGNKRRKILNMERERYLRRREQEERDGTVARYTVY